MNGPLEETVVIEICSAISGPFATKLLGDMGAEVIKVEPTETGAADRIRDLPYDRHGNDEFTWRFLNYNTSKKSVSLDIKDEAGKNALRELVSDADVLVENMRPGSMERLDLGWETLRDLNPELVFCSIKGYSSDGPSTDRPALDTLIQAVSGFGTQVGDTDEPESLNLFAIDMFTGMYAAWSISMALLERASSGKGQRIDVSMLDTAISLLGHQLAEYTAGRHHETYEPTYSNTFAPNGYFRTADSYLCLFITDRRWDDFCTAIDRPEWTDGDHPYSTNAKRMDNLEDFEADLEVTLRRRTTDEWMEHFTSLDAQILAAPFNDIEDVVDDPQVVAQNAILERTHPDMGEYVLPNVVPKFSRTQGHITDAPGMGEDTDSVLGAVGFSEDELAEMRERGIVE